MKKLIIIAALVIPFGASAAQSSYCQKYGELAAAIAHERDIGTPRVKVALAAADMKIDAGRKMEIIDLIDVVYENEKLADAPPELIGEAVMLACLKSERGR